MMTPLRREQLRFAILYLLVKRILHAVADQEISRGGRPRITEFLEKQISEFSKLVAVEIQDAERGAPLLPDELVAFPDTRLLKAEIDDVSGELASLLESILRERGDLQPL